MINSDQYSIIFSHVFFFQKKDILFQFNGGYKNQPIIQQIHLVVHLPSKLVNEVQKLLVSQASYSITMPMYMKIIKLWKKNIYIYIGKVLYIICYVAKLRQRVRACIECCAQNLRVTFQNNSCKARFSSQLQSPSSHQGFHFNCRKRQRNPFGEGDHYLPMIIPNYHSNPYAIFYLKQSSIEVHLVLRAFWRFPTCRWSDHKCC